MGGEGGGGTGGGGLGDGCGGGGGLGLGGGGVGGGGLQAGCAGVGARPVSTQFTATRTSGIETCPKAEDMPRQIPQRALSALLHERTERTVLRTALGCALGMR